jgi:hypothetical protein
VVPLKTKRNHRIMPPDGTYQHASALSSKATMQFTSRPDWGRDQADGGIIWKNKENDGLLPLLGESVLGFVGRLLLPNFGHVVEATTIMPAHKTLEIPFYTEYVRHGTIYRAHPKYRGKNPYYDWAFVRWVFDATTPNGEETIHNIIGRIHGFIRHPDGNLMAIVHSCKYGTNEQHGVFGTFWHLEYENETVPRPKFSLVNVDCLEHHACMIPYIDHDSYMWVHIWDPSEWPGCFQRIEPPHD